MSGSTTSVPPPTGPSAGGVGPVAGRLGAELMRHGKRWLTCDFSRMSATDEERQALAQADPPITDPTTQDYVAWRRSMAWIGAIFGGIGTIHAFVDMVTQKTGGDSGQTGFVTFVLFVTFATHAALVVALVRSGLAWTQPALDRRRLRWGWAIALFAPVLMLLLPLKDLIFDLPEQAPVEPGALDARALQLGLAGLILAIMAFWHALPGLLSIFPGMMRAGALLKTLVPGRSTGPVVCLALGPIYSLLLLVVFTTIQQLSDSVLMLFGALALLSTPIVTWSAARDLVPPCSREEAGRRFATYRNRARWPTFVGLGLIVIGMLSTKIFGTPLIGFSEGMFKVHIVLLLAVWFFAMLTTYTVVSADALLQAMHLADEQSKSWSGSPDLARDVRLVADMEASLSPDGARAARGSGPSAT